MLDQIKGVGPQILKAFRKANIWSTYDLILHYPKRYETFSMTSIDHIKDKEVVTVLATITSDLQYSKFQKLERIMFQVEVFGQKIKAIAFGRGYLKDQYKQHDEIIIKGTYHAYKKEINIQTITKREKHQLFKPIYGIDGVPDYHVQKIVHEIIETKAVQIYEIIPIEFIKKYRLVSRYDAYVALHSPKSPDDIRQAKRRFKYEEAFFLQLKLLSQKQENIRRPKKAYQANKLKEKIEKLPYQLTNDQQNALKDVLNDFNQERASYRLIQGDVGSGKTLVSALAIYAVTTANEQAAFMAPTETLANQHFQYFQTVFPEIKTALLTSKTKSKGQLKEELKQKKYDLVIGTHALIESDVEFQNLGLIIIDEQHKFGVATRDELIKKAHYKDIIYLTATPIPRTLALIAYGSSRTSIIYEKPKNRQPITTRLITKDQSQKLYDEMHQRLRKQEQVYVVVPAIDSDQVTDNITSLYQELKAEFDNPVFVLHGQLKSEEKESVMAAFLRTPGSILLATTVIEVGIDVANASLIAIYSAERFGLSQLHQLRGRVGRGTISSSCYLISDKEDIERLHLLTTTDDGFALSAFDLNQRGPGDFLGNAQSGFLDFKFLDLIADEVILMEAQKNVLSLFAKSDFDSNPEYKYLRRHIDAY